MALGRSSLAVERSTNGGRTWAIASQLELGLTPQAATPAEWFEALGPAQWLVLAPTEIFSTSDAGQHWAVTRSALDLRSPAYFDSLSQGFVESSGFSQSFVQGSGFTVAWGTVDGGRQWSPEPLPASLHGAAAAQMGAPVSIIASAGPGLLVAAGNAGLYVSRDGGQTWAHPLGHELPVDRLDLVGPDLAFASTSGELLRSTDGATTWAPVLQPPGGAVLSVDFWSAEAGIAETDGPYYVTYDAGSHWSALALPGGWHAGPMNGDGSPGALCFSQGGTGWAAVSHHDELAVLVSTDGGRHWHVALPPRRLPGAVPTKRGGSELLGAEVEMAGCQGGEAWVLVAQPAALGDMPDVPYTFDLLVTEDVGLTWEDVLQAKGSRIVTRPRAAVPAAGTAQADQGFSYSLPQSAVSPVPGALWLTSYNENFGGEAFASTADGGQHWAQSYVRGQVARAGQPLPPNGWASTAASSGAEGWALFSGAVPSTAPRALSCTSPMRAAPPGPGRRRSPGPGGKVIEPGL